MTTALANTTKTDAAPLEVRFIDAIDSLSKYYQGRQASLSSNLMNGVSGMGSGADKAAWFQYLPFWLNSRQFIENMTINSWAADRFVQMPVNDMFTRPREYDNDAFKEESERVKADTAVARGMRLGRKIGTSLLWAVTTEADPTEPLNIDAIRPGDLANLMVVDRYDVSIHRYNTDIYSENFGQPEWYRINIHKAARTFTVHHSRVYRFDGMKADSENGWSSYFKDWGISNLAHAMTDIFNDASAYQAVSHLVQEASIPVQKVDGLAEIICSGAQSLPDEPSIEDKMIALNRMKDIYSTVLMDKNDDFSREAVNFANVPQLVEKFSDRLAMAAGVSATRFLNKSPDGQNSTGKGDMLNDNRTTAARQEHLLKPAYRWLDKLIAKSAGTDVPEYVFPPLFEMTEKEVAEVVEIRSKAANNMIKDGVWTEDEAKEYVATGIIPDGSVDPALEERRKEAEELEAQRLEEQRILQQVVE